MKTNEVDPNGHLRDIKTQDQAQQLVSLFGKYKQYLAKKEPASNERMPIINSLAS